MGDSKIRQIEAEYLIKPYEFHSEMQKGDALVSILENTAILENEDLSELKNSKKEKLLAQLRTRVENINTKVAEAEENNGALRRVFSWFKNNGFDWIASSTNDVLKAQKRELALLSNGSVEEIFFEITGQEYNTENIDKFLTGEILTKSEIALKSYTEGQQGISDFQSDLVSGWMATLTYTLVGGVIAAAGAPVALVAGGAVVAAAAIGAGTKILSKMSSAKASNEQYDTLAKDALIGGINGVFAPLAAIGAGKLASKAVTGLGGVATKAVGKAAEKATQEGVEFVANKSSSLLSTILNPYGYHYHGSKMIGAIGYTTEYTVGGMLTGSIDASARAAYEGEDFSNVAKAGAQGMLWGGVGSLAFGWGLKGLGSAFHNKGHNIGFEFNDGPSINENVLIEAGANPVKRYKIPKTTNNSSGYLHSGIPIMSIVKYLGAQGNYTTLDDVVEDYLMHRFFNMKRLSPEQYSEFMSSRTSKINPMEEISISPRQFVEDVLFQNESLSFFEQFEYNRFRRKFDIDGIKSSIEDLLVYYEANTPKIHARGRKKQVRISQEKEIRKQIENNKQVSKTIKENTVQELDNANSNNELVSEISSMKSEQQSASVDTKVNPSNNTDYIKLETVKGKPTLYEAQLKKELEILKDSGDVELYNELALIFNKFCGKNREQGKNIISQFLLQYQAKKGDMIEIQALIRKYKDVPLPETSNLTVKAGIEVQEVSPHVRKPKLTDDFDELIRQYADNILNDGSIDVSLVKTLNKNEADVFLEKIIRTCLAQGIEPNSNLFTSLNLDLIHLKNKLGHIDMFPVNNARLALYKKQLNIPAMKKSLHTMQNDYRASIIQRIMNEIDDSSCTPQSIIKALNLQETWALKPNDIDEICTFVTARSKITEYSLEDLFSGVYLNSELVDVIDQVAEIRMLDPYLELDLLQNKLKNIGENFGKFTEQEKFLYVELLKKGEDIHIDSDLIRFLEECPQIRNNTNYFEIKKFCRLLNISADRLFDEEGMIFDLIDNDVFKIFNLSNFQDISKQKKDNIEYIIKFINNLYKMSSAQNLQELRRFFEINNIVSVNKNNGAFIFNFSRTDLPFENKASFFSKVFSKIYGKSKFGDHGKTMDFDGFVSELHRTYKYDHNNTSSYNNSYSNIYGYLGIRRDFSCYSVFEPINNRSFERRAYAKIYELCRILKHPDFDIFTDNHAKMRFVERFVLDGYDVNDISDMSKHVHSCLENLKAALSSNTLRLSKYVKTSDERKIVAQGAKITVIFQDKQIDVTIDSDGKIRTLFQQVVKKS